MTGKLQKKLVVFLFGLLICAALPLSARAAEEEKVKKVVQLYAVYHGDTILVGEEFSRGDLDVSAIYEDGTTEEVLDYSLSTTRITSDGANTIRVIYRGKMCDVIIMGKKPLSLYAYYMGEQISVGNSVSRDNISVNVNFTDGSFAEVTNYKLENDVINTTGTQKVRVTYNGLAATFDVYGVAAKPLTDLFATFEGSVMQGNPLPASRLYVTAVYNDGTTERINNYVATPEVIEDIGINVVTITYRGKQVKLNVECTVKTVESITVTYTGGAVAVGDYVDTDFVKVVARYEDGFEAEVKDFTLLGGRIIAVGNNTVTANYYNIKATFLVQGVKEQKPNYSNATTYTVKNETRSATVRVALPSKYPKDIIDAKSLKPDRVELMLGKLGVEMIDYIAFDIVLSDETRDDVFPLTTQIKLPSYYDPEQTHLYYGANRKTVLAQLNVEMVDEDTMELTIYHPGTYILTYEELPEEDEDEEEDDDYL